MSRRHIELWEGLVAPASLASPRDRHLSRTLNIILIMLLAWGAATAIQYAILDTGSPLVFAMMAALAFAYVINRRGIFLQAAILTTGLFITGIFVTALTRQQGGLGELSVLYYLIIPILMAELFFSMLGYFVTAGIILAGVYGLALLSPDTQMMLAFLAVFSALIGFSTFHRRAIEREQLELAGQSTRARRPPDQRRSARLGLLEEVGGRINESLDEHEILERSVGTLVHRLGYAEAAISLLVDEDTLEVAAITGTQDFGYRPGYRQKTGRGIIGHVGKTRSPYLTTDVSKDPYYFSSAERTGSAIGVPILVEDGLLGVIYVESSVPHDLNQDDLQTLQTLANQVAAALQKARLHSRTQEHLRVMTTLQSISHVVTSSLDLNDILHNVIRLLKDSFGYSYISVYLLDSDVLHLGAEIGYPVEMVIYQIPIDTGVAGRAVRLKETQLVRDVSTDRDFLRAAAEVKCEICVPLMKNESVLGVLNVESRGDRPLDDDDVNLLDTLAGSLAVAIDNARLHAEVKRMALTDAVSGLANRRAFDEFLQTEITRAKRYGDPLSLIILDLDSFKEFNDRWGHPAGDVRLREVADMLRDKVRDPDMAARYGGEEFAVVLPNTPKEGAVVLAERLRVFAEENAPVRPMKGAPVAGYTISLGVATFPEDAGTITELLVAADQAEIAAKRLGKNRVCAADISNPSHV